MNVHRYAALALCACLAAPAQQLMAEPAESAASDAAAERDAKLRREMEQIFEKYPDKFSREIRQGFADRQVVIGMDPYLAHLTAGAFTYKVEADPSKWPGHADPMQVMWAQARRPDDSKIAMTFDNATQYPGQGKVRFTVLIEQGKVKEIRRM